MLDLFDQVVGPIEKLGCREIVDSVADIFAWDLVKKKVSEYTHQASCSLDSLLLLIYALPFLLLALLLFLLLLLLPMLTLGAMDLACLELILVGIVVVEG